MKRLLIAVAALSIAGGTAAMAQPGPGFDRDRDGVPNRYDRDRDGDRIPNRYDRAPNRPGPGGPPPGAYRDRDRDGIPNRFDRRDNRFYYGGRYYDRFRGPAYVYPRGYAYRPWARGQYLPRSYFASPYYIDNWRVYGLRPPPPGYRYVRVGNDVVLAAIAGGLIAEVINGLFY